MPPLLHDALTDTINLSFEQTVPRSLVHKRSLENVLLTEISACAEDRFICAGRVPTAHRFFNDAGRTPHTDILFYTELGRQASLAVSHQFLNVSKDDVFIFEGSHASLGAGAWLAPHQPSSDAVIVQIRAREISRRKNDAVSRVVADHIMWIGGEQVFTGTGAWTIQPSALFQRLRRSAAAHAPAATIPEPAATTARLQTATGVNVVISAPRESEGGGGVTASLVVDASHPYFFDHACDHVPGMLLLEGCAQLALVADAAAGSGDASTRVASYEMTFAQFVERHVPATLTAHVDAGYAGAERRVSIGISQNGSECGRATIGLRSAGR